MVAKNKSANIWTKLRFKLKTITQQKIGSQGQVEIWLKSLRYKCCGLPKAMPIYRKQKQKLKWIRVLVTFSIQFHLSKKKAKIPRIMERKFNSIMPFHFSAKPLHLIGVFYEIIDIFHCNSYSLFKTLQEKRKPLRFVPLMIHSFISRPKWRKTKGVGLRFSFPISHFIMFHYKCIVLDVFCGLRLHEFNMTNIKHRLAFAIQWLHKLTTQAIKFYRYDFLVKMAVANVFNEFSLHFFLFLPMVDSSDFRTLNGCLLASPFVLHHLAQFTKPIIIIVVVFIILCLVQNTLNIFSRDRWSMSVSLCGFIFRIIYEINEDSYPPFVSVVKLVARKWKQWKIYCRHTTHKKWRHSNSSLI